jgi:hypothetical protein
MDIARFFEVNELVDVVTKGKTWKQLIFVFVDAPSDVVGNTCLERPRCIGHDVNVVVRFLGICAARNEIETLRYAQGDTPSLQRTEV